jgi:plasmid segregation protein ParM
MVASLVRTFAYGHDFGNAEVGGVVIDGNNILKRTMPTAISIGDPRTLKSLGVVLDSEDYVFQMEGETNSYYIGKLALTQGSAPTSERGNIRRYEGDNSVRTMLVNAATLIGRNAFKLRVVTGLPVETYKDDPAARQRIIDKLNGVYNFSLNGYKHTVEVEVERVLPEGSSAIITGGQRDKVLQGVIDIGGRTTDLYVSNGMNPMVSACIGSPLGVETATDILIRNVKAYYGRVLDQDEARTIMHAYVAGRSHSAISHNGKDIEVDSFAAEAVDLVGGQILSWVASRWNSSEMGDVGARYKRIFLIGGGALYFFDQLKKRIPHLEMLSEPEFVNALGYATMAYQALRKDESRAS